MADYRQGQTGINAYLVENYPAVWSNVRNEVATFVDWLRVLAAEITKS
jgi:hypothetical protein